MLAAPTTSLLDELQAALTHGSLARRVQTLRSVTDLFVYGARDFSAQQIALFDDVFLCLADYLETNAIAQLAEKLAPIPTAPPRIVRTLALADPVEVAVPVLSQSTVLDEETLILVARSKSQDHLLAISKRNTIAPQITDVLVERGNKDVLHSAVTNPGAQFSDNGYSGLVERAIGDDDLTTSLGLRRGVPRHHYLKLIARASNAVLLKLRAANSVGTDDVANAVNTAALLALSDPSGISPETLRARNLVISLHADGRLNEFQVAAFAEAAKFDEVNAALACLTRANIELVETMVTSESVEGVLVLTKAASMCWATVKSILLMREELHGASNMDLEASRTMFEQFRTSTAQQVLHFNRAQKQPASSVAGWI